jgi:hypothetical protein
MVDRVLLRAMIDPGWSWTAEQARFGRIGKDHRDSGNNGQFSCSILEPSKQEELNQ